MILPSTLSIDAAVAATFDDLVAAYRDDGFNEQTAREFAAALSGEFVAD